MKSQKINLENGYLIDESAPGWHVFRSIEARAFKASKKHDPDNKLKDDDSELSTAEFRIPVLFDQENIKKAYEAMLEFWKTRPDGVKLPHIAKIVNAAEESAKDKHSWQPHEGIQYDQRGKEICCYVTYGPDGEPSLTTQEYKNFILKFTKFLQDKGVQGIGYYPSISADRSLVSESPDLPIISTFMEFYSGTKLKGKEPFSQDPDSFNQRCPLHDLTITREDLERTFTKADLESFKQNFMDYNFKSPKEFIKLYQEKIKKCIEQSKSGEKKVFALNSEEQKEVEQIHTDLQTLEAECKKHNFEFKLPTKEEIGKIIEVDPATALEISRAAKHMQCQIKQFEKAQEMDLATLRSSILELLDTPNLEKETFADEVYKAVIEKVKELQGGKDLSTEQHEKIKNFKNHLSGEFANYKKASEENKLTDLDKLSFVQRIIDKIKSIFPIFGKTNAQQNEEKASNQQKAGSTFVDKVLQQAKDQGVELTR